jgi:serine protease Do
MDDSPEERPPVTAAPRPRLALAGLFGASLLASGLFLALGPDGLAQERERGRVQPNGRAGGPVSYADVLEPALLAVVNVEAERGGRPREDAEGSFFPWFFRGDEDDGDRAPSRPRGESQGSGVIVSADGLILTNNHVVEGANRVRVRLADRRELRARIVGRDAASDIAVLKVSGTDMPTIPFGSATDLRIGDVVFALGSPLGLEQTATMGIVSAKGRSDLNITNYDNLIQTDAAINPGNSGGAMINAHGELVGINTAILYRGTASFQGVGLSIPIELARNVMNQILENGRVVRAFLGVNLETVDAQLARRFGMDSPRGAIVSRVLRDTPAANAGLRSGDVILGVDGNDVAGVGELRLAISGRAPGDRVRLQVLRDGDRRTLTAKLVELTDGEQAPARERPAPRDELWGITLDAITGDLRRQFDLDADTEGLVVTGVTPGSPAAREGLDPGNVILRIERKPIASLDDASRMLEEHEDDTLLLLVRSGELTRFVVLEK